MVTIQPITRILAFKFVGEHGNQHRKHCIIPDKKNNWYRYYGERKRTKISSPNGRGVAAIAAGVRSEQLHFM